MSRHVFVVFCILICSVWPTGLTAADVILKNNKGVEWIVSDTPQGYTFGKVLFNGKLLEAPLMQGILNFKNTENDSVYWFFASKVDRVNKNFKDIYI